MPLGHHLRASDAGFTLVLGKPAAIFPDAAHGKFCQNRRLALHHPLGDPALIVFEVCAPTFKAGAGQAQEFGWIDISGVQGADDFIQWQQSIEICHPG